MSMVRRELTLLFGLLSFNVGMFTLNNYVAAKYLVDDKEYLVFIIYPVLFFLGLGILIKLWTDDEKDNEDIE